MNVTAEMLDRAAEVLADGPRKIQHLTLPVGLPEFTGIRPLSAAMRADDRFRLIEPGDPDANFITTWRWALREEVMS